MEIPTGPITLDTPLGPSQFLLDTLSGTEELGRLFAYEVELLSDTPGLRGPQLLGQPLAVHVSLDNGQVRHFHGILTNFRVVEAFGELVRYAATIRPWFWLLTRTHNCRIFQNKSVPEIVKELLRLHGLADFEEALFETYEAREYVVQYLESDFNFISRLLEDEGIYYYFRHEASRHVMVLADSGAGHNPAPGCQPLPYSSPDRHQQKYEEVVQRWDGAEHVRTGKFAHTDYDFEKPSADLSAQAAMPRQYAYADFERFQFPGNYVERSRGEALARVRIEEIQADYEKAHGSTNAYGLAVGFRMTLSEHPQADQNREYLVVRTHIELHAPAIRSGRKRDLFYHADFAAVPREVPFRPARLSDKPRVLGPQTAMVVGKEGEEIWTDEYGRIKVKFHWDRYGEPNENASCWIRVAQLWAGGGWGGIHIPRIGHEVIVDFLNGDPDAPIVTGCVYNKLNMPPYALPTKPTQSGIKSRSTPEGSPNNFNEIRFEDKKGSEELYVQAEKNQTSLVKNDQSLSVGANRSVSVGANQTTSVSGTRTTSVTKKDTQTFSDEQAITVTLAQTGTYNQGRTTSVNAKDDKLTVSGANKTTTVHGKYEITADTLFQVTEGGDTFLMKAGNLKATNGQCTFEIKDTDVTISAAAKIKLECGSASITLTQDGTITIDGSSKVELLSKMIDAAGQTKTTVSGAQASIELAAAGATVSGPKATVSAAGVTEITGALVKIN